MKKLFHIVLTNTLATVFLFVLCFLFCNRTTAQSFSIGFNIATQLETTNYGGQSITGIKSNKIFTFEDSAIGLMQRQSIGMGISFIRTLPKNTFILIDLNMALYTSTDFRFYEYDSLEFNYLATSINANILFQKYFGKLHVGIGYRPFFVYNEGVYADKKGTPFVSDFEGILYHKKPYLKNYLHAELGFKWVMSPFVAINYGLIRKQNFINKSEVYFDFGFRVFLDLNTKLGNYKIFNPQE